MIDKNVELKEEDYKNNGEDECRGKNTLEGVKECLAESKKTTYRNAKERIQQEKNVDTVKKYNEIKKKCEAATVLQRCESAHASSQKLMAMSDGGEQDLLNNAIKMCSSRCTLVTPSVDAMVLGCSAFAKSNLSKQLDPRHRTCGVPGGGSAKRDSGACGSAACVDGEIEDLDKNLNKEDAIVRKKCRAGDAESCKGAMPNDAAEKFARLRNLNQADEVTRTSFNTTYSTDLGDGVTASKTYGKGDTDKYANYMYTSADGGQHSSYAEARTASCAAGTVAACDISYVPVPAPAPREPQVSAGLNGGSGVNAGSGLLRETGSTSGGATNNSGSTTNSGSGERVASTGEKANQAESKNGGDPGQRVQQAATNGGSSSGGNSGSSGGSTASLFPDSPINYNLPSAGSSGSGSSFQATGAGSTGSSWNDAVGAGGESGGSWSDSGSSRSFTGTGTRSNAHDLPNSEGVNRNTASMGGMGGIGSSSGAFSLASAKRDAGSGNRSGSGDLNSAAFQSGYHKAPPAVEKMNSAQKAALREKIRRLGKNAKISGCRDNDLQCFANFFNKRSSKMAKYKNKKPFFQQRGIASVQGQLPKGVWRGYVDILSHMAKVHDKMPMNFEGEID